MSNTTITAGYVAPAVVTLKDAATISVDASAGNDFRVTISGNRRMKSPSNPVDGQRIMNGKEVIHSVRSLRFPDSRYVII